jgi:glycosyltransferase involved in cell wall biosynthesis
MFRNGLITKWPEWYRDLRYGDWPLHLLHAEHGAIGYLDQIMAVYRVHADSVFGGMSEDEQLRDVLAFYDEIDACFEYAHHAGVERGRARHEALLSELTGKRAPSPSSAPVAAPPRTPRPRRRDPDVSVVMIAYNVEDYIEHALESVLMQDGDFSCEVLVGEDCSIDGTRDIVLRYAHEHPDEIRPLLRDSNLGMNPNFSATYLESTGRYIALLDGDDFWTSRLKIAKQIAFMESHPECAICFHNTTVVYDDGTNPQHPFHMRRPRHRIASRVPKPFSAVRDLVAGNFMQTCSVMYRGGLVRELPEWYLSMPTFDWPLHVLHAEHGDIGYIDEVMGTYRVHPGGFWSTGMSRYERVEDVETLIRAYHTLDRHLQHRFSDGIRRALPYFYCEAAAAALRAGDAVKAREYATMVMQSPDAGVERERERATRLLDRLSNR